MCRDRASLVCRNKIANLCTFCTYHQTGWAHSSRVMPTLSRSPLWNTLRQNRHLRRFNSNLTSTRQAHPPPPGRLGKYARRAGYVVLGLGTAYEVDKHYNASAIFRNLRTLWTVRREQMCCSLALLTRWAHTVCRDYARLQAQLHPREKRSNPSIA